MDDVVSFPVREVIHDTTEWQDKSSWGPVDDKDFALDPRGGLLYDNALRAEVGENPVSSPAPKKVYTKSRVSVSFVSVLLTMDVNTFLCRKDPT